MISTTKKILLALTLLTACNRAPQQAHFNELTLSEKRQNWELLFNGNDFTGWTGINNKDFPADVWTITDNALACTGIKGESIITSGQYRNFELTWEWKLTEPGANSGIKYFVNAETGLGIEYQMIDDDEWVRSGRMRANDYHTTGAVYELYAPSPEKTLNPVGHWNSAKVVSKNGDTEHWLNGKKIAKYNRFSDEFKQKVRLSKFAPVAGFGLNEEGHILLQNHESKVYFRNIKIKRL